MEKADSLLAPILKRLGMEEGVRLAQIKSGWYTIFNEPLSLHMYPSRLSEGELLLNVDSPIWNQQLSFYKRDIIRKLSVYGVREVRFRIGGVVQKKQPRPQVQNPAGLSAEDAAFLEELLSGVTDDTLRDAVKVAAEKYLLASAHHRKQEKK